MATRAGLAGTRLSWMQHLGVWQVQTLADLHHNAPLQALLESTRRDATNTIGMGFYSFMTGCGPLDICISALMFVLLFHFRQAALERFPFKQPLTVFLDWSCSGRQIDTVVTQTPEEGSHTTIHQSEII